MRAIGHMILSGAFERHPDLKFVVTEITSASQVLAYLGGLDTMLKVTNLGEHSPMHEHISDAVQALTLTASEYFARNCYLAGPTHDLRQAYDAGVPNLMWGADFPHSEGTHPFTVEAIRVMLSDLPVDQLDELLAVRAATLYGFDLAELQSVADRIGPTVEELTTPLAVEDYPVYPDETRCTIFNVGLARLATTA
jgi:hypothetical protein